MTTRTVSRAAMFWLLSISLHATAGAADPPAASDNDFRAAAAQHGATSGDPNYAGIWKGATPPPGSTHGEFDNNDPVGLSAGVKIPADCSINWLDPDSGKRYCFSSATSLVSFLAEPHDYLRRATAAWTRLKSVGDR